MAKKASAKSATEITERGVHAASTTELQDAPKRAEARAPKTAKVMLDQRN